MSMSRVMAACVALARHFSGGADGLGRLMGISNLADKLNPNNRAQLTLDEAVMMELLSGDYRILRAHAEECRHFPPLPMPEGFDAGAEPCMQTLARTAKEFADLVAVVSPVAAAGDLSDSALAQVRQELDELNLMTTKLAVQLAAMNAAGKRRGEAR